MIAWDERIEPSEAGDIEGIPDPSGHRAGGWLKPDYNTDLPDEAYWQRPGLFIKVTGPSGAEQAHQALPHGGGRLSLTGYMAMHGFFRYESIAEKIELQVDQAATNAQLEIRAMCESARRSMGQLMRKDYLERHND